MLTRLIVPVALLLLPGVALASDPSPELEDQMAITPEFLQGALSEANKEFEDTLREREKKGPTEAPLKAKVSHPEKSSKGSLPSTVRLENDTLLQDLAEQVDALKNKVVVEKTTLLATQSPRKVRVLGAKTVFNYQETAIYEVTSALNHITDIQLKPGESLTTAPMAGDTVRWNVGVMKSGQAPDEVTHLIIKALDENVETNLVITTDMHVYQVRLKSGSFHMPVVSWNYPEDFESQVQEALKKEQAEEATISPENLRFTYVIDGEDYDWKPVRVFDDGSKTFIQMPTSMRVSDAPALFLIEDGSEPMLVNYRVKGDYYIVDRLFEKAELRVGPKRKVSIEAGQKKNFFRRLFS